MIIADKGDPNFLNQIAFETPYLLDI